MNLVSTRGLVPSILYTPESEVAPKPKLLPFYIPV